MRLLIVLLFITATAVAQGQPQKSNVKLFAGVQSFLSLNGQERFTLAPHSHYLHGVVEAQFDDLSVFGVIGSTCQLGVRSYGGPLYTSLSYSINTVDPTAIEQGAQVEVGGFIDFGKNKAIRLAIGGGLGFHFLNKLASNPDTGNTRIFIRPIGVRLSFDFNKVKG